MNQTGESPDFPIEGSITGLLNFNSADPVTQVSALNMQLSTETGWLSNLLKIEDLPIPEAGEGNAVTGTPPSDDGWGSTGSSTTHTSTTGTKVSDDGWGNSTNSGGDDWGSSGSSGSSSSTKDDW